MHDFTITKQLVSSGSGLLVWMPKAITSHFSLSERSFLSVSIGLAKSERECSFTKRLRRVAKNYYLWIPLDVVEFLHLKEKSLVRLGVSILEER